MSDMNMIHEIPNNGEFIRDASVCCSPLSSSLLLLPTSVVHLALIAAGTTQDFCLASKRRQPAALHVTFRRVRCCNAGQQLLGLVMAKAVADDLFALPELAAKRSSRQQAPQRVRMDGG
jgi:hypothetical protein